MKFYSADYILPITSKPIEQGIIAIDDNNVIQKIGSFEEFPAIDIHKFDGVLLPGFVNAHCHLELSHMKGKTKTGTTLIPFISDVVKFRDFDKAIIEAAIEQQDKEMYESGIQAVGDISNKVDTAMVKRKSPVAYYTFVEMFDFMQEKLTAPTIAQYSEVFKQQDGTGNNKKSFVPHAPYSVSQNLFEFINDNNPDDVTISLHNQETLAENQLFMEASGDFYAFYEGFGFNLDGFEAIGKGSIYYALKEMKPKARNLFVHNTLSTESDIRAAHEWSSHVYWATCPNANLYIENRLPNYQGFLNQKAKMCIGTDSIMSNWQLSVWEEVKTIKKYQSYVPLKEILKWATINGAESLGYDHLMGSLEVGKSPGLVHVDIDWNGEDTDISRSRSVRVSA